MMKAASVPAEVKASAGSTILVLMRLTIGRMAHLREKIVSMAKTV
jgi:hypothetical protein